MKLVMKMENNNLSVYFVSLPTNASTSKLGLHIDSQKNNNNNNKRKTKRKIKNEFQQPGYLKNKLNC